MIELLSTSTILARPKYGWLGGWHDTRSWWKREEDVAVAALCEIGASLEKSADGLGRSPTSIAHRARDAGIKMPREWKDAIQRSRPKSARDVPLQYPYVRQVRGEHADLLLVNSLIPRYLPDHVRADVCQEIMLALWQKETTIEDLRADKALIRKFTSGFYSSNFEQGGHALSLDAPMRDGRSWYSVLPDNEEHRL
jgi:hypothetical protein